MKKRDFGIEFLRCLLMLGICLIHATAYSRDRCWWLGNIASCSVDAFVFISAWYGIRFSWRKIMSLAGMAAWCAVAVVGIDWLAHDSGEGIVDFIRSFMRQFSSYWFLWSYVVVMMFAPMIDKGLDACEDMKESFKVVLPVALLVFGWNFVSSEVSVTLQTAFPAPAGFGSHTFLALIGVYVTGRFVRKWLVGFVPERRKLLAICVVLMAVVSLDPRLGRYYSPLSIIVAACWVLIFKGAKIPCWMERVVGFIAPSLFAVYLFHVSNIGNHALIWFDEKCSFVGCAGLRSILVSVIVFIICIIMDLPRRAFSWGWILFRLHADAMNSGDKKEIV